MRISILALLFVFLFSFVASAQDQIKTFEVKTGFHCANGKALLEKELVKVDGVKEATASVETKIVTIKYDSKLVDEKALIAAIEKIGYTTEYTPDDKPINKACSHDKGEEGHNH